MRGRTPEVDGFIIWHPTLIFFQAELEALMLIKKIKTLMLAIITLVCQNG